VVQRRWCPDVDEWRRRCVELGGRATRVLVERIDARAGTVVWRRCSIMAFIGWGTTGGGLSRSNQRWLGGTSMAKPFRVGRKWGGEMGSRGRGTAAPIRFAAGEEGSLGVAGARGGCGGGGAQSGFQRKKTAGLTDRVGPPVSERRLNRTSSVVEKMDQLRKRTSVAMGRLGRTGRE
jgi:hypothetical protein